MSHKITLIRVRRPTSDNINKELQWLGSSLGLFNMRDRNSSCFRVFITLVRKAKRNESISSDEIAERLNLSRGTVIHHITKLMNSGLVVKENKGYMLRENTLKSVMRDIQRDINGIFTELEELADEIDKKLG